MESIKSPLRNKLIILGCLQTGSLLAGPASPLLRSGDVVLRKERNIISTIFANASGTGGRYSHAGIVVMNEGVPFVIHVEDFGSGEALHRQSLGDYLYKAERYAFYRIPTPLSEKTLLDKLSSFSSVKFDYEFRLDNDKLYCTEFVYSILFGPPTNCGCSVILISTLIRNMHSIGEYEEDKQ
jgi:hypothetical protein